MLNNCFKNSRTINKFQTGVSGPYLDGFIQCLHESGYKTSRMGRLIRGSYRFGEWVKEEG